MRYRLPVAGTDNADALLYSAGYHRDLIRLLNDYHSGKLTNRPPTEVFEPNRIWIENEAGDIDAGQVLQIDSMSQPDSTTVEGFFESPTMSAIAPVWHTAIDNLVVVNQSVPGAAMFPYPQRNWVAVPVVIVEDTDRYVMLDPANPKDLKTCDAGLWKIVGLDLENAKAVIDLTQSKQRFRFKLTEDAQTHPDTTEAKLLRWDGDDITEGNDRIQLTDHDGLLSDAGATVDTLGKCELIGNLFVPYDVQCG